MRDTLNAGCFHAECRKFGHPAALTRETVDFTASRRRWVNAQLQEPEAVTGRCRPRTADDRSRWLARRRAPIARTRCAVPSLTKQKSMRLPLLAVAPSPSACPAATHASTKPAEPVEAAIASLAGPTMRSYSAAREVKLKSPIRIAVSRHRRHSTLPSSPRRAQDVRRTTRRLRLARARGCRAVHRPAATASPRPRWLRCSRIDAHRIPTLRVAMTASSAPC